MGILEQCLQRIGPVDRRAMETARQRQNQLTKPLGSLGRLEELSIQVAGIIGQPAPKLKHKTIIVAAADHGVVAEGVSAYPQQVTAQMVENFIAGGAAINVLSRHVDARLLVVDVGVATEIKPRVGLFSKRIAPGTANMAKGPAMTREQAVMSIETGITIADAELRKGADIFAIGDMGIGNTTAASAITAAITGRPPLEVTGAGAGLTEEQRRHKAEVVQRALDVNKPNGQDALDVLAKVGGFEIGALAGVILAAAAHRRPVVLDGFISSSAALIACGMKPMIRDYLIAAHMSVEPGHKVILEHLKLTPLLDLGMRLGEGTGAALGMFLVDGAARLLSEMATFSQAGVSEKNAQERPQAAPTRPPSP
ncbi:MAG: nicotinate-nucleotide--dimethylbenzimidazole phosphoribosyltransferase [Dehalococcoidia bacterium]|nr:nicotinate-nucleotide--dimethylbenzimidazole phosphoribosyltransferase [Dehalococcoidia bacterium]